jgi:RNA polymerase sigma-70 factor (ECF subfamily)
MAVLDDAYASARAAWPTLASVTEAELRAWIAARAHAGGGTAGDHDPGAELRVTDLYLACACARGDGVAIALFEQHFLGEVDHAAAKLRVSPPVADEARQVVRDLLFVGRGGSPPAISSYAGRGDLRGWTRVVAMRELLKIRARDSKEVPIGDEALLDALSPANDPELELARERYREVFARAFRDALARLPPRDRGLLRHLLIDGFTLDTIGGMYGVHRATAARWVASARQDLLDGTKAGLAKELALSGDEVDSVIRIVRSRLDLSVERLLRS